MRQEVSREDREKLMKVISDPDSRRKFKANRKQALKDAGVTEGPAVDELAATLDEMSPEELEVIGKLNTKMVEMGLTEEGSSYLGRAV
jgi:hypothetical protein